MAKIPEHKMGAFETYLATLLPPPNEVRRNPRSARPHRTAGPPPGTTDAELDAIRRRAMAVFAERRGCPAHVHPEFIGVLRRQGEWYG